MKKFLIGVCLIVVLLLAAVLIGPSFIDWNSYKGEIVEAARKATGRALSIDGDLSLRLLPAPALSAEGIRLANVEGGSEPDMARLAELDVRLALAPLLSGNIQVKRVRLIEPVLLLETTADGTNNWSFAAEEGAEARPSAGPSETGGGQLDLRFDEVELVDAALFTGMRGLGPKKPSLDCPRPHPPGPSGGRSTRRAAFPPEAFHFRSISRSGC